MPKQRDPLSRIFIGFFKIHVFLAVIAMVVFAGIVGFSLDFASCFGKSSCSNGGGFYFLLFPFVIIAASFFGLSKWRSYKDLKYKEDTRSEVLQEMGTFGTTRPDSLESAILAALDQKGQLSMNQLQIMTASNPDEIYAAVRSLIQENLVIQEIIDNSAYFTLSR